LVGAAKENAQEPKDTLMKLASNMHTGAYWLRIIKVWRQEHKD